MADGAGAEEQEQVRGAEMRAGAELHTGFLAVLFLAPTPPHYLVTTFFLQIHRPHVVRPYLLFFLRRSFALVTQAGVQWRDLGSPFLRLLGSGNSPASAS